MAIKIAINGFGRIGRNVLRAVIEQGIDDIDVIAVNDLAPPETLAHLLKYDSVHGRLNEQMSLSGDKLTVGRHAIQLSAIRNPSELPWQDVEIAFECTGLFTTCEKAKLHLNNGSRRVLVSAPCNDAHRTIVFGVNDHMLTKDDHVISNASCTTNCLAPMAMVLDETFGIKTGYMTTIHAFTGDQPTHDANHRDFYRSRAASLSMTPTSTGAAKAIALVLPQLKGKLEGSAVRVPVPNVSMVDLTFVPEKTAKKDEINSLMDKASRTSLAGILAYDEAPLVSVDFNHDPHSVCFAPSQTAVTEDGLIRVVGWYDNEWGFSNRMIDTGRRIGQLLHS
ncbi:MAG: type I glyceraldehyde-3-phosphate dehydrogenase [Aestuariivita sp.]|nr:type I glyceraldehyde-3-phosphate dehydrogenase [Aestuariivita sp.]